MSNLRKLLRTFECETLGLTLRANCLLFARTHFILLFIKKLFTGGHTLLACIYLFFSLFDGYEAFRLDDFCAKFSIGDNLCRTFLCLKNLLLGLKLNRATTRQPNEHTQYVAKDNAADA